MRRYIFTDLERRKLRRWLETGEETQDLRNIFVDLRGSLDRVVGDVELMVAVARRLRERGRIGGRAVMRRGSGSASR
jgi:hypothetical protein